MSSRKLSADNRYQVSEVQGIEDYGLIGDMRTCALVGYNGSLDYMCWPQFDSPSLFCRLLDTTKGEGGHWSVHPNVDAMCKQNYLASSNILQTKWINEGGVVTMNDCFFVPHESKVGLHPLNDNGHSSILVRRLECVRGEMPINVDIYPKPGYANRQDKGLTVQLSQVTCNQQRGIYSQHVVWKRVSGRARSASDNARAVDPPPVSVMYLPGNEPVDGQTAQLFQTQSANDGSTRVKTTLRLVEGQQIVMVMSNQLQDPARDDPLKYEEETKRFWSSWIRKCLYRGRFQQEVERSMLILKLMTFKPTGAIVASPTFSLPEHIGGPRNWDYRYSWIRDSSFTVYVFLKMGFAEEAESFINFIFDRIAEWQAQNCDKSPENASHLPLMYSIHGSPNLPEYELPHLGGYKDSQPVRVGNAATTHVQLDIYGELLDAIYLYNKHGKPVSYDQWVAIRHIIDFVCTVWNEPDMSIWEVRGHKENFVYSKIMLWVAIDRGLRLSEKANLPCPNRHHWQRNRDAIYESVMEHGFNKELKCFVQSYESGTTLDAAVLIAPLVFFTAPNDPRFLGTLEQILKSPEKGGLTSAGFVFRYNHEKTNDGTSSIPSAWRSLGLLLHLIELCYI